MLRAEGLGPKSALAPEVIVKPSETSGEPSVGGGVSLLTVEAERESLNLSRVQAERLAKSADLVRAANTVFEAALAAKDELIAELARLLAESSGGSPGSIERSDPQAATGRTVGPVSGSARFHLSAVTGKSSASESSPGDLSSSLEMRLREEIETLEAASASLEEELDQARSEPGQASDGDAVLEAEIESSARDPVKLQVQVATLEASVKKLRAGWDEARSDVVEASRATAAREAAVRELKASLSISEASRSELLTRLERR